MVDGLVAPVGYCGLRLRSARRDGRKNSSASNSQLGLGCWRGAGAEEKYHIASHRITQNNIAQHSTAVASFTLLQLAFSSWKPAVRRHRSESDDGTQLVTPSAMPCSVGYARKVPRMMPCHCRHRTCFLSPRHGSNPTCSRFLCRTGFEFLLQHRILRCTPLHSWETSIIHPVSLTLVIGAADGTFGQRFGQTRRIIRDTPSRCRGMDAARHLPLRVQLWHRRMHEDAA